MIDRTGTRGIFVECKFTSSKMPHKEYEGLKTAMDVEEKHVFFVSKSGYEDSVKRHAKEDGAVLLGLEDLFNL